MLGTYFSGVIRIAVVSFCKNINGIYMGSFECFLPSSFVKLCPNIFKVFRGVKIQMYLAA